MVPSKVSLQSDIERKANYINFSFTLKETYILICIANLFLKQPCPVLLSLLFTNQ